MTWSEPHAMFEIVEKESSVGCLVIRDLGPWDRHKTVTNDAEHVVNMLIKADILKPGQRLLYYDSESRRTEIIHNPSGFVRFRF